MYLQLADAVGVPVVGGCGWCTCNCRMQFAIQNPLTGRMTARTASAASDAAPTIVQTSAVLMMMRSGTMKKTAVYGGSICKRSASTDIRLTISPTVVCFRAALDSRKLWATAHTSYCELVTSC